jgi:hypothetical protein
MVQIVPSQPFRQPSRPDQTDTSFIMNFNSAGPFAYAPLAGNDIRLVRLLGSLDKASPIECALVHAPLLNTHYEALSYTWGDAKVRDESILLDGCVFQVTKNLKAALQTLRQEGADRHLWIDYLCINQADIAEKNKEVLRMLRIYQEATRVVIWLGEEAGTTELAMHHLRHLARQSTPPAVRPFTQRLCLLAAFLPDFVRSAALAVWQHSGDAFTALGACLVLKYWPHGSSLSAWFLYFIFLYHTVIYISKLGFLTLEAFFNTYKARVGSHGTSPSRELVGALHELFARRWFTRVWVIQEVAAAKEAIVLCGSHQLPWEALRDACRQLAHLTAGWRKTAWEDTGFQWAHHVASSLHIEAAASSDVPAGLESHKRSLLFLLCQFHVSEATDPRDKVYALLGLAKEIRNPPYDIPLFQPDYGLNLKDTYANVARFLIDSSGNLGVFRVCLGASTIQHLPSWVPDWSIPSWRLLQGKFETFQLDEKSRASRVVSYSQDFHSIRVQGFRLGYLRGQPLLSKKPTTDDRRLLVQWSANFVLPTLSTLVSSRLTWTLLGVMVRFFTYWFPDGQAERGEIFEIYRDAFQAPAPSSDQTRKLQVDIGIEASKLKSLRTLGNLKIFAVEYVPELPRLWLFICATRANDPRQGDSLWLIHGANVPVLLRQDGTRWKLVGPADYGPAHVLWKRCLQRYHGGRMSLEHLTIG